MLCYITLCIVFVGFAFGQETADAPKVCYLYLFIIIDFLFSTTRKTSASHTCSNIKTLHNAATTVQAICRFASDDLVK